MPLTRFLTSVAIAAAAAPLASAELVEVYAVGSTVFTDAEEAAPIPDYFHLDWESNHLEITAVFDSERAPIELTADEAVYEALYGYGMVNGVMVPLYGITLTVAVGEAPWFYLFGTTTDGWEMWCGGYSTDPQFVPSLDFPVDGFVEPGFEYERRFDVGADGPGWATYTDQESLPEFRRIGNAEPVWENHAIQAQYGRFTLTYDATPSVVGIDAVTGLSRLAANHFADLAPIVRFAPSGVVDARNGSGYQAVTALRYEAGVTYQIEMTVDLWTKRYSATVAPLGGTPVLIAQDYAFRTEHATANELKYFNVYAKNGTLAVANLMLRSESPGTAVLFSAGTWENASLPAHGSVFTVVYDVTPSRSTLDAVTGLSNGAADWFTDMAAIVRFGPNGYIDARHDGRYRAETRMRYEAGVTYQVRLTVDLQAKRYTAVVKPEGRTPRKIADNYLFRRDQAQVNNLDTFVLFSSGGGAAEVSRLVVK